MLRLYSDPGAILTGTDPVVILYPFWARAAEDARDPSGGRFDDYVELGRTFFEVTSLEEADVAVFPTPWERVINNTAAQQLAEQFSRAVNRASKPMVVFFWSDLADAVRLDATTVLRTSLYRSQRRPREFAMPAWSEDFVARYCHGELTLRPYQEKPVVGFCGYAPQYDTTDLPWGERLQHSLSARANRLKKWFRPHRVNHHFLRTTALRSLASDPRIETNFVVRSSFWAGGITQDGSVNWLRLAQARQEYVANMVACDYVLCVRGAGNFSYRLYEALSCGRIPVFVDTDCVLPYEELIRWRDYCVWVDESDLGQIAPRVAEHHANTTPQEFQDRQRACRVLWENFLRPTGFFQHFHRHFD